MQSRHNLRNGGQAAPNTGASQGQTATGSPILPPSQRVATARTLPPLPSAPPGPIARVTGAGSLKILLSDESDRVEQARLYDACFAKADGLQALPWRYDGNPHGPCVSPIARDSAGQLLASYACSPRRVLFRGQTIDGGFVGQTGDVMTAKSLRSKGVFSDLHWVAMEEIQQRSWPAAWGLPNENSGRIFFGKLGWQLAGHIGPWNFVFNAGPAARRERLAHGRLAAWGVPWAAWQGKRARRNLQEKAQACSARPLASFPREVLEISKVVEPHFDWMVRRDKDYLDWRFLAAPSRRFRALGIYNQNGEFCGYSVVQLPLPSQDVGFVVDLLGVDTVACAAAMEAALQLLATTGCAVARAYAMQDSWWEQSLALAGFRGPRQRKEVGAYALVERNPLAQATLHTSRWYFMDGDRDDETAR